LFICAESSAFLRRHQKSFLLGNTKISTLPSLITTLISELLNQRSKTTQIKQLNIKLNNRAITEDDKIADSFNEYFSTIGCTLSDKIIGNDADPMRFVTPIHGNPFDFTSITIQETIDALNQIKSKKSPGLDGISTRLLKYATNIIAGPLVNIFNVSFQKAIFPDD
jgi:PPE-repeat protein